MNLWKEIKSIPSSEKDLRKFGVTLGVFFGILGAVLWWKGRPPGIYTLFAAVFFLFFGLALPGFLKPVQKVWMGLALCIGWVMTRLILTAVFYLVLTPIGFFLRLSGKDLMQARDGRDEGTYWKDHSLRDNASYENQF